MTSKLQSVTKGQYFKEISDLLSLSNSETFKLLDDKKIHLSNDQIRSEIKLSTKSQLIYHQIKELNLKKIFSRNFIPRLITFFKKKIFLNVKIDKKKVIENNLILNNALIEFKKNEKLIKDYFLRSNKEFFKKNKVSPNIKKFYL